MTPKYIDRSNRLICSATGDEFPHDGSQAGKAAAIEKLRAHQTKALANLEPKRPSARQHFFGEPVKHIETRTKDELREARLAKTPKQSSGIPATPINPVERTIEAEISRHYAGWETSYTGRRVIANLKRQSKEWEANQRAKSQQANFEKSIAPVVDHARSNLDAVRNDPSATQLEVEQAEERYKLAQSGDVAGYSAADKEWRQRQSEKIVAQAVEVDSQLNQLRQQRDALLQAAYEKPAETEPQMVEVWYPPNYIDPAKAGKTILEPAPQGI